MKRNSKHISSGETVSPNPPSGARELDGFVELGMKREALCEARRLLRNTPITAGQFNAAMDAALTQEDRLKSWVPLVESAYARLSKREQRVVNFSMLSFHYSNKDYEAASRFIPRRFGGEFGLTELAFAWDIWLALGKKDETEKLGRKLPRAIEKAELPMVRAQLLCCLAEHFARRGKWNESVGIWELVQLDEIFLPNAVHGIVEAHVARALRAIECGFQLLEKFNQRVDPELATTLPGNEKKRHYKTEKEFLRLQKLLETIMPVERQKELGIAKQ